MKNLEEKLVIVLAIVVFIGLVVLLLVTHPNL